MNELGNNTEQSFNVHITSQVQLGIFRSVSTFGTVSKEK